MAVAVHARVRDLLVQTCHRRSAPRDEVAFTAAFIPSTPRSRGETRLRSRRCTRTSSARPARASTHLGRSSRPRPDRAYPSSQPRETSSTFDARTSKPSRLLFSTCVPTPARRRSEASAERERRHPVQSRVLNASCAAAIANLMEDAATSEISARSLAVAAPRTLQHRRGRETIDAEMEKLAEVPRIARRASCLNRWR